MKTIRILFSAPFAATGCFIGASSAQPILKPIPVQKQIKLPTQQEMSKIFTRERARIVPLSQADKLNIVNDALKEKGMTKANSLALPVKMTSSNPRQSADNYLMYFKPWNVLVLDDAVQFSSAASWGDSSLAISYKPPAPGKYLVDLSVRKISAMTFTLFTLDGKNNQTLQYPQTPEKFAHITFVVDFDAATTQGIFIYADSEWSFYDCEISQIK